MRTALSFEYGHETPLPPEFDEIRTPDGLVEHFLRECSDPGDRVFDPFAGFGTTLQVAERLDRVPVGVEYDPEHLAVLEDRVSATEYVRQGDVLALDPSTLPNSDCCFTSPPFMERTDHRNPFRNYEGESSYEAYLDDVERAFRTVAAVLRPGARVVLDVANIKYEDRVTPLAWDIAEKLADVFHFEGEVVVTWTGEGNPDAGAGTYGFGYDHTYCLVFTVDDS